MKTNIIMTMEKAFEIMKMVANDKEVKIKIGEMEITIYPRDCNEHYIEMEMNNFKVMYSKSIYASEVYATAYGLRIGNFQIRYEE